MDAVDPRAGDATHWNAAYSQGDEGRSWFQVSPAVSLRLIAQSHADPAAPVLDAGGGASRLVDALIRQGFTDLTVADISETALSLTRRRLGTAAERVAWVCADLAGWRPPRRFAVWHDRAVFHFLTSHADQQGYIDGLRAGTVRSAAVIIGAFAPDGPQRCSGLPVQRWSSAELARRIGAPFVLQHAETEVHVTPSGGEQHFAWTVLRRQD